MKRISLTMAFFAMFSVLAMAVDGDGDGMDDAWETSMGLSPSNATDAFTDKDGDSIPNLWEFARGTAANNTASLPAYDAIVTMNPVSGASPPQFSSLQGAYNSLTGPAGTYFLVQVKRGIHRAELSMSGVALRVAWIAETGADRISGLEGVILSQGIGGNESPAGLEFGEDTLMNGFVMDGSSLYLQAPAVRTSAVNGLSRVCLLNTIIRNWNPILNSGSTYISGAIQNAGAVLYLLHCTLERSAAASPVSPYGVAVIENKAGSSQLRIVNSLIWSSPDNPANPSNLSAYQIVRGDVSKVWVTTSHLQGLANSGFNTSQVPATGNSAAWPTITWGGYLQSTSPTTAKNGGSAQGVTIDIQNQSRPLVITTTAKVAMGAVQWVDADADTLPDWWEQFWFGNLAKANTGAASISDPDGDGLLNFNECFYNSAPVDDQDGDGLLDSWEIWYFQFIGAQNASGNPDNDGRTNLQEFLAETNPTALDEDFDGDGDGLMDFWEIQFFGNITAQNGTDDLDFGGPDGADNLAEQARGSSPNWIDADWDSDGWNDLWEKQTFGTLTELPSTDFDGDGLLNAFELIFGSSPVLADTNGDGVSDGLALQFGLPVFDLGTDSDGDGLSDAWEISHGTRAFLADSDGDGVSDALDALPLDPLASTGISVAGPPVITLTSPPNAVLQP